ncbi:MAG: hypothetical protein ACJAVF_002483 [Paraglaciecola sp.]
MSPKGGGIAVNLANEDTRGKVVFYGNLCNQPVRNHYYIPAQSLLFSETIYPSLMLSANSYQWQNFTLWSVERRASEHQQFIDNQIFGFDLIEMLFFHLSRYEEYHAPDIKLDWNDELPSQKHFLVQHRLHHQPVVDHLVYCFWQSLGFEIEQKMTTFRLSHDIDVLQKYPNIQGSLRSLASAVKAKRNVAIIKKIAKSWYHTQQKNAPDPFDTFEWLLTENSIEKVIYFMAGGETRFDNHYQIDGSAAIEIIQDAQQKGYKIGLHPSYNAYLNADLFLAEKEKLEKMTGQEIIHNRMHYLRYSFQKTGEIIEKADIQEDSTMGYQDAIGFRCGTGFAYRLFDFENEKSTAFLELPMVVMDCGLLEEVGYDVKKASQLLTRFLKENQFLTKITFNFHNSIFDPARVDEVAFKEFYLRLIEQISDE